jgi:hypothetical protein
MRLEREIGSIENSSSGLHRLVIDPKSGVREAEPILSIMLEKVAMDPPNLAMGQEYRIRYLQNKALHKSLDMQRISLHTPDRLAFGSLELTDF